MTPGTVTSAPTARYFWLTQWSLGVSDLDLSVNLAGLTLKNPVIAASGVFGYGEEYVKVGDIRWFGAVSVKGTTLNPRAGNPPPRTCETPAGMLNSIGLENPGAKVVIEEKLPWLAQFGVPVIVNISGESYEEFRTLGSMFSESPLVSALEVNVSCPNVRAGGMAFGVDPRSCYRATYAVRRAWHGPLIVKLTPNVQDISSVARAAVEGGADAISLINTLVGLAIDIKKRKPVLGSVTGGLSGPAIKPVALRCVYEVSQAVPVPVIGMGGILDYRDALEFIMAGATAVAVGTAVLVNPSVPRSIVEGLIKYGQEEGVERISDLVGVAWR
ncbi:MAG: dihydroorotate dehydrogenase [Candidatus Fermentithermobacillus carboniphilus]|uniref:Dihydroorotate dehydrogenase n=1 Tax=Candidatus Fermentithermobacillus carboniphilus TaxID=3085328 RepID=A0AAT9LC47_9FIRM|nr:MAG: dihydroorotate dehydrogenase [Candidatus Fermentithermobacillus carboniphilus]